MYKDLDPILHSQLRLAVVSILASVEKADFAYLKTETGATSGNLSVQITKLKEAGYIEVNKRFKGIEPAPAGIGYNFIDWYVPEGEVRYKF